MFQRNNNTESNRPLDKITSIACFALIGAAGLIVILLVMIEVGVFYPRKIEIGFYTGDASKQYDGTPIDAGDSLSLMWGELLDGHAARVVNYAMRTDIGAEDNIIEFIIEDEFGADVTKQYNIHMQYGTIEVKPISINVFTDSMLKKYDGKPLVCNSWTFVDDNKLLQGHTISIECKAQITDAGSIDNIPTVIIEDAAGDDVTDMYNIVVHAGVLRVDPMKITVQTGSYTGAYDGNPVSNPNYDIIDGFLLEGHTIEVLSFTKHDRLGKVDNHIEFVVHDKKNNNVTHNYSFEYSMGTLNVTHRKLVIQTISRTKVYDGTALYDATYDILFGSLCDGHELSLVCDSLTGVGKKDNTVVSYTIYYTDSDNRQIDVTNCYQITFLYGTLTVKGEK